MDLDIWDCFGRKKLSYNRRNTVYVVTSSLEPPYVDIFSLRNKKHDFGVTVVKAPRMLHFVKGGVI